MHHRQFDRPHLQHLGAQRRHFKHLLEGDPGKPPGLGLDARVGRIDAVDVGIDIAAVGLHRRGDRNRTGIGSATPQRRDAVVGTDALEAGDDSHLSLAEALDQERAVDVIDAGSAVRVVGPDRDLPALPRTRMHAHRL